MAYDENGNYIADTVTPPTTDPTGNYTWDGSSWTPKTNPNAGTYVNGVYQPLVMGTGDEAAANTTASILRGNYDNWKKTYFPKIGELMNQTTYNNPNLVAQETAKTQQQVVGAFGNARGANDRNMARYGMAQSADATSALDSSMELSQAAAEVGGMNTTRQALDDRNRAIASGGLPKAVQGA